MSMATMREFQDSCFEKEELNDWLRKVKNDKTKYCGILCNKKLYLIWEDVL